ncbi:MAG TPA: ABC transporter substrate-binding protein [Acidimicrobiales bacterium]|nr:ABC transporter substrate-binding protein [Acidimicrobiales bacterium]
MKRPLIAAVASLLCAGTMLASSAPNAFAASSTAPLFKDLPAAIQQSKVINVGTSVAYPPYDYNTATNQTVIGFEPDLRAAIAKLLGITFVTHVVTFQELIPGIQAGRFQIAMDGISDTSSREKVVDFVDYGATGNVILVLTANKKGITDVDSLCGKSVGTAEGTEGGIRPVDIDKICKAEGKAPVQNVIFPDSPDIQLALKAGRVFSQLEDTATGGYDALVSHGQITAIPITKENSGVFIPDIFGIVVPKGQTQLEKALQAAFNTIIANGTYAAILKKWDLSGLAIKKSTINSAG